ncbi:MAG: hypothetical protein M1829_006637 [Trizodia sp. TS-e1964]|nr:MAG: hypothetical protein M1829_006637 [Trizodia sp. TS-e1964]
MAASYSQSPPVSASSSPISRGLETPLSLDLSNVPSLILPSCPTNTLLITNLQDPTIFRADQLLIIRDLINESAPIHSWSPLKSFRRIVVSFFDSDSAIRIRHILDGETVMGDRVKVYFGEPTPIKPIDQHLQAPRSQKLFFISPPPSPPHGWMMRHEEPPNKEVHADDLVAALSRLHSGLSNDEPNSPVSPQDDVMDIEPSRPRSNTTGSTTMIYHPSDHGDSPYLPTIAVEDMTNTPHDLSPLASPFPEMNLTATSRPPVELMMDA